MLAAANELPSCSPHVDHHLFSPFFVATINNLLGHHDLDLDLNGFHLFFLVIAVVGDPPSRISIFMVLVLSLLVVTTGDPLGCDLGCSCNMITSKLFNPCL